MHTHDITDTVSMITCCGRGRVKKEVLGVCKMDGEEKESDEERDEQTGDLWERDIRKEDAKGI